MAKTSAPRDPNICCIPNDITVRASTLLVECGEHGLHAIASKNINAGEIILQCSPLAHSLLVTPGINGDDGDDDKRKRCARCFFRQGRGSSSDQGRMNGLKRCSRCKIVYYCSRSCQAEDWLHHKLECQYYVKRRNIPSAGTMATSAEEDAIPLLLRTFAALVQLMKNSRTDCMKHGEIVSCGSKHFSSLAVSQEYRVSSPITQTSLQNSYAFNLARECMISYASTNNVDSKCDDHAATCVWGYVNANSDNSKERCYATFDSSIQRTLNAFQKNNFGITDTLHAIIGEGVFPSAALLNHSCNPNCILRYELSAPYDGNSNKYHSPILQIVACKDIQKGEELTHSYVDLALPTSERRSRLRLAHGFDCNCTRCSNGCFLRLPDDVTKWALWPLRQKMAPPQTSDYLVDVPLDDAITGKMNITSSTSYNDIIQQSRYFQEEAANCMLEGDTSGETSCLQKAIDLFKDLGHGLSPFNFKLYSIRCSYLSALLANGDIHGAVEQCEHVVSFLAVAFSHVQNHPLLGLQLFTLGDLYSAAADMGTTNFREKALLSYTWARDIMLITHGSTNSMVRSLEENLKRDSE